MTDKTFEAFEGTRKAGSIAAAALDEVAKIIEPGITTEKIDKLCFEFINDSGAFSAPLFYIGFPNVFKLNNPICLQGLRKKTRTFKEDI